MKIGLWNIDHPEKDSGNKSKQRRFNKITKYLTSANCDIYILTEANAAISLEGYASVFSTDSPFKSSRRFYGLPNIYHQVAIYSKVPLVQSEVIEPINSLQVKIETEGHLLNLYGNVVTLKDRWSKASDLKYNDRLEQQIESINKLPEQRTLVAGDFNLRLGWPQKKRAYKRLGDAITNKNLVWPTKKRVDTVQHVLHTKDLDIDLGFDFSVKHGDKLSKRLSDHPFIEISMTFK